MAFIPLICGYSS